MSGVLCPICATASNEPRMPQCERSDCPGKSAGLAMMKPRIPMSDQKAAARQVMAHTPGPWGRNIKPARKYPVIFAGRNTHVAKVLTDGLSDEEIEANADLIAAATDMLEALQLVHDKVLTEYHSRDSYVRQQVEAAIAKAAAG